MPLPKRPGPYILGLLIVILIVLTAWLFKVVTSPDLRDAARREAAKKIRTEADTEATR